MRFNQAAAVVQRKSNFGYTQHIAPEKFTIIESLFLESGKYLLKGQSFSQLYNSPINNRLRSLVPFANGFIPFSIIIFRNSEVRHKRMYGCGKKRLNTGTFF